VRSISEADMSCAFCWISAGRWDFDEVINAASYAEEGGGGKEG